MEESSIASTETPDTMLTAPKQGAAFDSETPINLHPNEATPCHVADGIETGDIVVTAGVNMLREKQKVRLAMPAAMAANR